MIEMDKLTKMEVNSHKTSKWPVLAIIKMKANTALPDYVTPRAKISAQFYTAEINAQVYLQLLKDEHVVAVEVSQALALN